ncbi:MAG: TlpA family protein disulfide reductase [Oligoflexia bacterium]|nr:TlpA family protein disulfide reductase [Oligoflexia bacterium]
MKNVFLAIAIGIGAFASNSFALEVGEQAPCVVLEHLGTPSGQDSTHCIRDAREGQKVILEFFSATCSDCAKNLPIVSNLSRELGNTALVRLVGIDRSEQLLRDHYNSNKNLIPGEVALDTDRDAKKAYGVVSTPTMFILDSEYKVIFKHKGVLKNSDVQEIKNLVRGE